MQSSPQRALDPASDNKQVILVKHCLTMLFFQLDSDSGVFAARFLSCTSCPWPSLSILNSTYHSGTQVDADGDHICWQNSGLCLPATSGEVKLHRTKMTLRERLNDGENPATSISPLTI